MSWAFLLTSLVIVAIPGTGALITLSAGVSRGVRAGVVAACGRPAAAKAGRRVRRTGGRLSRAGESRDCVRTASSAGLPGGSSDVLPGLADGGAVVTAVDVAPSGSLTARPDGPPLTAAPPTRCGSEVRYRPRLPPHPTTTATPAGDLSPTDLAHQPLHPLAIHLGDPDRGHVQVPQLVWLSTAGAT